ncbi:MAG: glycerol-3-phosphate dehydrogenase/oxidase [Actinomycetales bacterium]|nr:glycerol-3-phosphate dehydrogenase/oxidase [Actinomycetales bacterium]
MSNPTALSPAYRASAIEALSSGAELDVLVVGGGVTGSGCALDAVTRGLSVGLVEKRDFASGTSSRSSKLIHGGLRYLEMFDFALVAEALKERGLLLTRLAPHLVRPVPFLYPLTKPVVERPYVEAGLSLYDSMARAGKFSAGLPWHKHLTRRQALKIAPALKSTALVGAVHYYDAKVDDARHTMEIARTAASYGAHVATRVEVVGFLRQGERVTGVRALDKLSGREFEIHAKQVVNATGVWTDDTQAMVGERGQFHVRASKGIHLVVPRDRIHSKSGLILRTEKSVLFVIPWGRHWIIGTTDTDWDLDKAHPAATQADIDYLLGHVNRILTTELTQADVEGVYAGLRPLLSGESDQTSKLSREHIVAHPAPGLVVVAGGKYTTYRVMAKDAIDEAARGLGGDVPESTTEDIPMVGAVGYAAMWNRRAALARESGLHVERIEKMLMRHGILITEILTLVAEDASLGEPLAGGEDYLKAEIVYAASHEGALHLDDILARRTRLSIESFDRAITASRPAAELVAPVLGWDEATVEDEVEHYRQRVEAERISQTMPDDAAADAARLKAPDRG